MSVKLALVDLNFQRHVPRLVANLSFATAAAPLSRRDFQLATTHKSPLHNNTRLAKLRRSGTIMPPKKFKAASASKATVAAGPHAPIVTNRGKEIEATAAAARPRRSAGKATTSAATEKAPSKSASSMHHAFKYILFKLTANLLQKPSLQLRPPRSAVARL